MVVDRPTTVGRAVPAGTACLVAMTVAGWMLVGTMRYWWAWLWQLLGLVSVPVDMVVWLVPIALTIVIAPRLWHRFHYAWVIVIVVGMVSVGETVDVLSPWHEVLSRAVAAAFS